jgi:hypothetical protein
MENITKTTRDAIMTLVDSAIGEACLSGNDYGDPYEEVLNELTTLLDSITEK